MQVCEVLKFNSSDSSALDEGVFYAGTLID